MRTKNGLIYFTPRGEHDVPGFQWCGLDTASVPNDYTSYMALNQLGYKGVPHPLDDDRWYPGFEEGPLLHQKETAKHLVYNERAWCLNDMGTGKTASAIWAAEHLRHLGQVHRVLVLCPLSTLRLAWHKEIIKCYPLSKVALAYGAKQKRLKLFAHPYTYFLVNHEGLRVHDIEVAINKIPQLDLIIVDEAVAFKNPSTQQYQALARIAAGRRIWALTGQPTPNLPSDAWAMSKLINPFGTCMSYTRFKALTTINVNQFKPMARTDAPQQVAKIMQPAIRFKRSECVDLPPRLPTIRREATLSREQRTAFRSMAKQFMYLHEAGEVVTAVNAAVRISKLLQICCGGVYDDERKTIQLKNTNRLGVLAEVIEETNNKVLVFVAFKSAQAAVVEFLRGKGYTVGLLNGDVNLKDRTRICNNFQGKDDPRIIVAHPRVVAYGLTLTAADIVIWYAPIYSLDQYGQGNDRIDRIGQTAEFIRIVHIAAHSIEWQVYKSLEEKDSMQKSVLKLYEQIVKGD